MVSWRFGSQCAAGLYFRVLASGTEARMVTWHSASLLLGFLSASGMDVATGYSAPPVLTMVAAF